MQEETDARILRVAVIDRRLFLIGSGLILLSFLMPTLFTVTNFRVLYYLYRALNTNEKMDLINAAIRLVALNAVRACPHYVGAFLVAETLEFRSKTREIWYLNAALVILLLATIYWSIGALHDVHYDFGLPAIMAALLIILFDKLDYKYIAVLKKIGFIAMGLIMLQFLDVMPMAAFLPVGRGEVSMDIKLASMVLGAESELNTVTAIGSLLFACFAGLFFILLRDENWLREMDILKEQNAKIRTEARLNEMQNRTYREMQHLVHDLKSPLTVVQTLVGVFKMECETERRGEDLELLDRVENAVDQMSQMISEILYEEKTSLTTVEKILHRVSAQLSIEDYAPYIHLEAADAAAEIRVNCVLFPRALVNLVQNSAHAIPEGRTPQIRIRADSAGGWVRFQVIDNGKGISEQKQREIWNRGYSGTSSSGLGLSFVQNVVERVGGRIGLVSTEGEGTTITLWIPKEGEGHGSDPERDDLMH